jgi:hypothetical protein
MPATPTTRWSLIVAARGEGPTAADALAALCTAYRPVVAAHFRRQGLAGRAHARQPHAGTKASRPPASPTHDIGITHDCGRWR